MNVLLDLDGTLTDPADGITACIEHALRELGVDCPPREALHRYIGPPLHGTFKELLGGEARVEAAVSHYRERFSATGMYENSLYPGIPGYLAGLTAGGAQLYLATSKPGIFAVRILEHFGLRQYFTAVYGSELDGTRADKAELIAHVIRSESLQVDRTIMIGDRRQDIEGAKANTVFPVGVLWGYGSREELSAAGAGAMFEQPAELSWRRLSELLQSSVIPGRIPVSFDW